MAISRNAKKEASTLELPNQGEALSREAQAKRWFLLPQEARTLLCKVLKLKGPIVADRLKIRKYETLEKKTGDVRGIGSLAGLDGVALESFPDVLKFVNEVKITRGFWLNDVATMINKGINI